MKTENWFFIFVKPQAVYWSPLFSIFQIITGMMFFLLGLLIFLSLILNNIDKAIHSSAQKGYILNNGTLPNPMDMALVFLQNTFPLDYILYLGECLFGYWVSRFGSPIFFFMDIKRKNWKKNDSRKRGFLKKYNNFSFNANCFSRIIWIFLNGISWH